MRVVNSLSTSLFLGLAALMTIAGCGQAGAKNEVSGKVLLEGKPVSGNIIFVGTDKKEHLQLIGKDGDYSIDLAPGDYKVAIKSMSAAAATGAPPGGGTAPKEAPKGPDMPMAGGPSGTTAPAKYASPDESGLTFKHAGGKQKYSPELKP